MLLALDPASRTGWCLCDGHAVVSYGFFDVTKEGPEGDWLVDYERRIDKLLTETKPTSVFIESYFFGRRAPNGSTLNLLLRAAAYIAIRKQSIEYTLITPSAWFNFVVGGKPKDRKKATREALAERFGIQVPDKIPNANNRLILTPSDVTDAIGIAVYAAGFPASKPLSNGPPHKVSRHSLRGNSKAKGADAAEDPCAAAVCENNESAEEPAPQDSR